VLEGATPGIDDLPGLFNRGGFDSIRVGEKFRVRVRRILRAINPTTYPGGVPVRRALVLAISICSISASVAPAETLPQPSRAGLALQGAAVEVLAPAVHAVPDALQALESHNLAGNVPTQNGFHRPLVNARTVRLTSADLLRPTPFGLAGGVVTRSETRDLVWSGEVRVAQAWALRLHLGSVALPPGSRIWAYAPAGEARAIRLRGRNERADLWTGIVPGESLWLEVAVPAAALGPGAEARFTLDRVVELVDLDADGRPRLGAGIEEKSHCRVDAACVEEEFGHLTKDLRRAIARISFVRPDGAFLCSGGLVADAEPFQASQRAFFVTARHCIATQEVAETLFARFRLWSQSCGGPVAETEVVEGSDLLASVERADSTLLELHGLPPNPYFIPYDASPNAFVNGDLLHMLSHPGGQPLHFTQVQADPGCVNDEGIFSTVQIVGSAAGGSSGAPLVTADGKLVAQLGGGCAGPGPEDSCDPGYFLYFGRLARAYDAFAPFLEEPPPPPEEEYFTDPAYPGWKFRVNITAGSNTIVGTRESVCLPETVCVSGALAGRSEVFIRVIGPRPNGKLWPTLVKFTTSRVDIWIRQLSTGVEKHYVLEGASAGEDELPGLFDRGGFDP
jgi:hypothetical protein